jgi:hypothetical protein
MGERVCPLSHQWERARERVMPKLLDRKDGIYGGCMRGWFAAWIDLTCELFLQSGRVGTFFVPTL